MEMAEPFPAERVRSDTVVPGLLRHVNNRTALRQLTFGLKEQFGSGEGNSEVGTR